LRAHIAEHDPAAAKRVALHIFYRVDTYYRKIRSWARQAAFPARASW